ncbi:hypothetical protein [Methylobacterium oryzae]|uniref:Protein of unassigned function n=1 Tax=Methylobacterium oryzae CBMB20 TaxID=693986 RepID=A0A089Q285_9HYPH|nr:hypothetical protein [Methylobacterium oryzae]AIQ88709.1 protein of unassigned function [Methylobacterium oryzae CBMB20]
MPVTTAANAAITEAQFEAQLRAAILAAFPWLPTAGLVHQKSFTFRFGKATVTVNGDAKSYALARADVLVSFQGEPLAIFELKRPGLKLTADDEEQGLSYARLLQPRPPLVVVSNGQDVRTLETDSGEPWRPASKSQAALKALITRGVLVAAGDLKRAVDRLMGSDPAIWAQAIRQATAAVQDELVGDWDEPVQPFVRGFLMPRKATHETMKLLEAGHRLITIEGGPLVGKSNVLRELTQRTNQTDAFVLLYLDADVGLNLFERVALILADALDWPLTAEEARRWLTNLSRAGGPILVLAVDHIGPDRDDLRRDLETLTTNLFGPGVRVVLAVDDTVAEQLVNQRNGRGKSAFGRRAARISLYPLDNQEFKFAQWHLAASRLTFVDGAHHSSELRAPWLLRTMAADAATSDEYQNQNLVAAMSPVPGLELIEHARQTFDVSSAPYARFRELAQSVLADSQDRSRPHELVLELLETFLVRRSTALDHLGASDLRDMIAAGLIREARSQSGENVYVIRLPELVASELAQLLSDELPALARADPSEAAAWLAGAASNLPLGDVIAAQAVIDAALRNHRLDLQLISALRARPPAQITVPPGSRATALIHGLGIVDMTHNHDGSVLMEQGGQAHVIEPDEDDRDAPVAFDDFHPYLILSHLAGHALEEAGAQTAPAPRADPDLLVAVGSVPIILRRPGGDPDISAVPVHDIGSDLSVVCHRAGIVEPITWSLVRFFGRESEAMRDQFIDFALNAAKPALLPRLDIALRKISESADTNRAAWAQQVRNNRLRPFLDQVLRDYVH